MPDPTATPAHPWKKTARTALGGVITAAILLPLAIEAAGIDVTAEGWRWLGGVLVVLAAVTRVLALPQVNVMLERIGLGHDDVEAGQVVALQVQDGRAQTVVAGDASILPTGTPLDVSTTVGELGQTMPSRRGDAGHSMLETVLVAAAVSIVVLALWLTFGR